jgi:hypothetical protein
MHNWENWEDAGYFAHSDEEVRRFFFAAGVGQKSPQRWREPFERMTNPIFPGVECLAKVGLHQIWW